MLVLLLLLFLSLVLFGLRVADFEEFDCEEGHFDGLGE